MIAHRGGTARWPENTLAAFTAAAVEGFALETDVRVSADGVPICFHDATLDRITDDRGPVSERSLDHLRSVRVGAGHGLVTVAELLTALPTSRVVLDVKDDRVLLPLAAVIAQLGAIDRVCVTGCWDGRLKAMRDVVGPALATGLGWRELAMLACGAPTVAGRPTAPTRRWAFLPAQVARARTIRRAHELGLPVAVWTVNDPVAARGFVAAGVDAIISDRPELIAAACASMPSTDVDPRDELAAS